MKHTLSQSEQKIAAVMIVELAASQRSIQEVNDIVEEVIQRYRALQQKPPGVWQRLRRLAGRVLFPFGRR